MRIPHDNLDRPHIIPARKLRICRPRRVIVIFLVLALLATAAVLSWFFLLSPFTFKLKGTEYYMLALSETENLAEAKTLSAAIAGAGGGGYIINDGTFRVTAVVYKKAADADTVRQRLQDSFAGISVLEFKVKAKRPAMLNKSLFKVSGADKELKKILEYPIQLIDTVLEKDVRLDTFAATESAVLNELAAAKGTLDAHIRSLEKLAKDYPDSVVLDKACEFYTLLYEGYNNAVSLEGSGALSVRLKYFSCKAVYLYYNFRQNL